MQVEVDQSNRIEESGPTFVAFANHISYVIKIPTKVKNAGRQLLNAKGFPEKQINRILWAACIFLLLKDHLKNLAQSAHKIMIDNEFDGHQADIRAILLRYIRKYHPEFPERKFVIGSIGKKSSAHKKAWTARRNKSATDKIIHRDELLKVLA